MLKIELFQKVCIFQSFLSRTGQVLFHVFDVFTETAEIFYDLTEDADYLDHVFYGSDYEDQKWLRLGTKLSCDLVKILTN